MYFRLTSLKKDLHGFFNIPLEPEVFYKAGDGATPVRNG
ncbi:MAG: hypothetical protein PWP34_636 [Desulfuromonadales bacterium]|jgi:hypothetical protein|nr:hypothetical protein [Desulfuromonadales bacterium]